MPLPWVRLDSNIASHDKVLWLLEQRDGAKAFTLYICCLGYAGAHGTDGHIPHYALKVNHGSQRLARLLVDARLWTYAEDGSGYIIPKWAERQEMRVTTEERSRSATKAACVRWHGENCGCWTQSG